jgi:group I intron endonuclease
MDVQVHVKYCLYKKITRHKYYDIKRHVDDYFYGKTIDIRTRLIYKHTNKINGMCYIGQCLKYKNMTHEQSMLHRWQGHIKDTNKNSKYIFHKAIREFGPENFEHEIIDQFIPNQEEENEAEMYWIELYNCKVPHGYNMNEGGSGTSGFKQSKETIEKRNKKNKGVKRSQEICDKLKLAAQNRQPPSQKCKLKLSTPVNQHDLTGKFIKTYLSMLFASLETGINKTAISGCCSKKCKTAGGFIWCKVSDNLSEEQMIIEAQNLQKNKQINKTLGSKKIRAKDKTKIYRYDKQLNFIDVFNSILEASKITKISVYTISQCCKNKKQFVGDFIWKRF